MSTIWSTKKEIDAHIERQRQDRNELYAKKLVVVPVPPSFLDKITKDFNHYSDMSEYLKENHPSPVPEEARDLLSKHPRIQKSMLRGASVGNGWIEKRSPRYDAIVVAVIDMTMPKHVRPVDFSGDTRIWMCSNVERESCTKS